MLALPCLLHCWGAEGAGEHGFLCILPSAKGWQDMTANMTKEAPTFWTGSVLEQANKNSADSDTPHIIAKPLQQFPSISDNVTARYFERAPRTVHQLQAPVILSFLTCNLPRCCSAGRIFSRFVPTLFPFWCCFFWGGNSAEYFLYLSTTKALDGPSQAQLHLCLSWYHASNSYVPTCRNTSQPKSNGWQWFKWGKQGEIYG